jgi:hypothetical protein
MYSSLEVLRVLPLNGIAPVGGGGGTGQQASCLAIKSRITEPAEAIF